MTDYLVRQYRPNYFSGFEDAVEGPLPYDQITTASWFKNFQHQYDGGFKKFEIEDYGNGELIISAIYNNGKHWVAGFATEVGSRMSKDWRYQKPEKDHGPQEDQ